jgi:hypothetical protein
MMTKFEDALFDELIREHGPALAAIRPPASQRRLASRPVWLTGGGIAAIGATAAGLVLFSGGAPAYAVTQNSDGTATIAIHQLAGIKGANARLHALGDQVVVVPIQAGCPPITSLTAHAPSGEVTTSGAVSSDGQITVNVTGIPAGEIAVVGIQQTGSLVRMVQGITSGPAPSCLSIPANMPAGGSTQQTSGTGGTGGGPVTTQG